MLKKLILGFILSLCLIKFASAQSGLSANASPVIVGVNTSATYKNITFPYPTRNLMIENNDSADYVYVDVKSDTNTSSKSSCYLLGPDDTLELFDFVTSGISILRDTTYSTGDTASPISIIATY